MVITMIEIIRILTICILATVILKLFYLKYSRDSEAEKNTDCHLMKEEPSYKTYKKVSKKASSSNKPKRLTGDFFDYIFEGITSDQNAIENNILGIYGESIDD